MALLILAGCARAPESSVQPTTAIKTVDVLVQGAEMSELGPLLDALEAKQEVTIATWHFWLGTLKGKTVVVSLTEVGPMNASAATILAIERWQPRVILNQGTSGAHDPRLQVRDIVLGVKNVDFNAFKTQPGKAGEGVSLDRVLPTTIKMRIGALENRVALISSPAIPNSLSRR
ncbi:MAG: hypothetical protein U5J83_11180 [Bryobacterales bacterium]|nr:hypothetical protein [Bryobacterales bacterium]